MGDGDENLKFRIISESSDVDRKKRGKQRRGVRRRFEGFGEQYTSAVAWLRLRPQGFFLVQVGNSRT